MYPSLLETFAWLSKHEQSLAIWLEGFALVAIFFLELKEYWRQGRERIEQYKESTAQMAIMQSQADATRDAAIASKASADAVINAERSWVMADVEQERVQIFVTDSSSGGTTNSTHSGIPSIAVTFKNVGRVPCWITKKKIQFALVEKLPPEPTFDGNAVIDDFPEPVIVGQPLKVEWQHLHAPGEQLVTLSSVPTETPFAGSTYPIVYGIIKYRDVFSNDRETRFGYQIRPQGSLRRIKSARYNTNT